MKSNKVLIITGCLGFIGSYVTRACLEEGWYVIGVDKITYAANSKLIREFDIKYSDQFKFIKEDIVNLKMLHDCDYIINLAAESHVDNSIAKSDDFIHSNIKGVHNLLELIRTKHHFKMPTLLHFSTDEVYGDIAEGFHTEKDLLKPSNPYSATKAAADQLILAWNRTYKVPYIIVRPTNNYGIGQYVEKLIPKTCKFLELGRKIPLHEKGTPKRTWLHAKDTANAIITLIKFGVSNEIFNISGNYEEQNIKVVEKILRLYGIKDEDFENYIDFDMERLGQDVRYAIDDSKIKKLGWEQVCDFEEELKETTNFYKKNFIW
jgi:dTDP-glucose 4,6-dehydratase